MLRERVDALEERVRRLRTVVEHLDEEHTTVGERVRALEDSVNGSTSPAPGITEASDEEVAAAISAIVDAPEERGTEDQGDDLIVA